ncbi:MAG: SDR family oxidoreductase [Phycisphaerales bacterium]
MQVALITGGGSGIGLATALELAKRGFALCLAGRRGEVLEEAGALVRDAGAADVMLRWTDVSVEVESLELIERALEGLGRIDILINNAGSAPLQPVGTMKSTDITRCFEVNALAPAWMINAVWPHMVERGGGRIVNVSSMSARDPFPGFFAYAGAKAALNSFTRSIATEGEPHGIRGFCVAPGAVETTMLRELFDESRIARDDTLTPEDVAQIIVACAVGERDEDNGRTIWVSKDGAEVD